MTEESGQMRILAKAVARRVWFSRISLIWERLWPAVWPAVAIAGVFLAVSLLDFWVRLPGSLHAVALFAFAAGFFLTLFRGLRDLRMPSDEKALRRIETTSGFAHRPLRTLGDRPAIAADDADGRALWQVHLQRSAKAVRRMRVSLPKPGMARRDPLGLRAALLLILIIAGVVAGGDSAHRLARALQPDFNAASAGTAAALTLWLTPPPYTAMAPMFLTAETTGPVKAYDETIIVPSGATLLARVHGGAGVPVLDIDDNSAPFDNIDGANFEFSSIIESGRRITVRQGGEILGDWSITVVADQPPLIEFSQAPGRSPRAALRIDYIAEDDYGLVAIEAVISRLDDPKQNFFVSLPLPGERNLSAENSSFHDLTAHLWAGMEVSIELTASDALSQIGTSEPVAMTLPERIFSHPVARRLIEERRRLTLDPTQRNRVSATLDEISRRPEHFFEDIAVFLGLRAARQRLLYDVDDEAVAEVQEMLWDMALVIEDGPVALSQQALRDAEKALLDALSNDATDQEIDALVDKMLQALDDFLNALARQAANQDATEPTLEDQLSQAVTRDQIRDMVERVRELAKTGSREAAREMLEQLQAALDSMRANSMRGDNKKTGGEAQKILRDLEKMITKQQELLDDSFRRGKNEGNGDQPGPVGRGGSQSGAPGDPTTNGSPSAPGMSQQQALRDNLGDLMRRWGASGQSIPLPLNRADQAMQEALQALSAGLPGQAVGPQTSAIDEMSQGAKSLLQSMMKALGRSPPRSSGMTGGFGNNLDLLGRGMIGRGYQDDNKTRIPSEADMQRSRQILDELYRRAGDFQRPAIEKDYIKRLLKRF